MDSGDVIPTAIERSARLANMILMLGKIEDFDAEEMKGMYSRILRSLESGRPSKHQSAEIDRPDMAMVAACEFGIQLPPSAMIF
jgi:hypothetical protein